MIHTPEFWVFAASLILSAGVFAWSIMRIRSITGWFPALLAVLVFLWNTACVLELAAEQQNMKAFFIRMQWSAHAFIPVVWLALAFAYTGRKKAPVFWVLLSCVPAAGIIASWLLPLPGIEQAGQWVYMGNEYWHWVGFFQISYSFLTASAAALVFFRGMLHAHPLYRRQAAALFAALLLPAAIAVLFFLGYSPMDQVNLTSAACSIALIITAFSLYRYQFLDFIPMARDTVFDRMDTGILVCDRHGRLVEFNQRASQLTGITVRDLLQPADHLHIGAFSQAVTEMTRRDAAAVLVEVPGDPMQFYTVDASAIRSPAGEILATIISIRDCTEQQLSLRHIRKLERTDRLTGLYNRDTFLELGEEALRSEKAASLIMLDIDNLQSVNDALGSMEGDRALMAVGNELRRCARTQDIPGRSGGDEFVLLMPGMTRGAAVTAALSLHRAVEKLPKNEVLVTVSIGVVSSQNPGGIAQLLSAAAKALSRAKQQGKNQVVSATI